MNNHKKYVLWIIDIAKLLAVVCGTFSGTFYKRIFLWDSVLGRVDDN